MFLRTLLLAVPLLLSCVHSASDSPGATAVNGRDPAVAAGSSPELAEPTPTSAGGKDTSPRTVRDYFMLLPEKYFVLESCDKKKDKDCRKAKLEYLKTFTQVEDAANGYLKGGCDGAQSCMEMAIFKRPDGTYLVGLATENESINDNYFLSFAEGKWTDVSTEVVPDFSKKNLYELPRYGTTVQVFAKKIIEEGPDFVASEKGEKLYDLEWKNGKFAKK
jgi:hypothetical protein